MEFIVSLTRGKNLMNNTSTTLNILAVKFDKRKASALVGYFSGSIQKLEEGDCVYAQKIIDQVSTTELPSEGVRLQIPRACIFLYDITSNRGGRHDSDEFDPNEMDAITASALCSWILAELVRFCASNGLSPDEAQKIVKSVIVKRYPIFEEIEGRIYVDNEKHKSALQCALMILYKKFPERMNRSELAEAVKRHGYGKFALKFERLTPFIDFDDSGNMLLRTTGRKKVEKILAN